MLAALLSGIELQFEGWNLPGTTLLTGIVVIVCFLFREKAPTPRPYQGLNHLPSPKPLNGQPAPLQRAVHSEAFSRKAHQRSKSDKRSSLRRGGNPVPVMIRDDSAEAAPTDALVLDRSRGGLLVSVPQPISAGTLLSVRLPNVEEDDSWVQIEVRHCRQRDDRWLLGCAFRKEHPWSTLLLFG